MGGLRQNVWRADISLNWRGFLVAQLFAQAAEICSHYQNRGKNTTEEPGGAIFIDAM